MNTTEEKRSNINTHEIARKNGIHLNLKMVAEANES